MAHQGSIRENVLDYLIAHSGEDMTTARIAEGTGHTRTQVTTALHSLSKDRLAGTLTRTGTATWCYEGVTHGFTRETEDIALRSKFEAIVVGIEDSDQGRSYIAVTPNGSLMRIIPIQEMRIARDMFNQIWGAGPS